MSQLDVNIYRDIIANVISYYLSYEDLKSLAMTNKDLCTMLSGILRERSNNAIQFSNIIPPRILKMIGLCNLIEGEKVEWDPKWRGNTGYIDRIRSEYISHKLIYGSDSYDRHFIAFNILIQIVGNNNKTTTDKNTNNNKTTNNKTPNNKATACIFKRYTNKDTYVMCSRSSDVERIFMDGSSLISDKTKSLLSKLFKDGNLEVDITNFYEETTKYKISF